MNGEIYQYVGDEVVITWNLKKGLEKNNCVLCFFRIEETINTRKTGSPKRYIFAL